MSDTAPRSALSERLTRVFGGLRHVIGEWWGQHRIDDALIHVVWVGLGVRLNRLTSLIKRFEAGTLPTPRAPRPRATPPVPSDSLKRQPVTCQPSSFDPGACPPEACKPAARKPGPGGASPGGAGPGRAGPGDAWAAAVAAVRLPRRKAWLLGKIQPTALYYWELRKLLDDPQMVALLAATPQAGRLLRPLWHMIAPHPMPDILRLPPRPRRPSPLATAVPDAEAVAMGESPRPAGPPPASTASAVAAASRVRRKPAAFARPRPGQFLPA